MRALLNWTIILSLVVIRAGLIRAQQASPPTGSLLEHATKLADASKWVQPYYIWYDSHTLLTFTWDQQALGYYHFGLLDIRTGHSQPWTQLDQKWTRYLAAFGPSYVADEFEVITDLSLSPDRNWLLVNTRIASNYIHEDVLPDGWGLISLTGDLLLPPRIRPYDRIFWETPIWNPDSRTFATMDYDGHIQTHSAPTFALLHDTPSAKIPNSALFDFGWVEALGLRDDGRLLVVSQTSSTSEPTRLKLVNVGLSTAALPPEVTPVALPQPLILRSEALSPNRKQILYFAVGNEFWLSRADGSGMKRLGWIPEDVYPEVPWNNRPPQYGVGSRQPAFQRPVQRRSVSDPDRLVGRSCFKSQGWLKESNKVAW